MAIISLALLLTLYLANFNITIEGNIFFSDDYLLKSSKTREVDDIDKLIEHILDVYTAAGFPFCEIRPIVQEYSGQENRVILNVSEGQRIVIHDHLFTTNGKSDPRTIKRFTRSKKDTHFSSNEITRIKSSLIHTKIFSHVSDDIVLHNDEYYVHWTLDEQPTDFINAFGTVSEEDYIFSVSLYSINLLGSLRTLEFLYEYDKLLTLKFVEPIIVAPVSIQGNLALWSYDTMQLFELNGKVSAPIHKVLTVSILSGIERVSYTIPGTSTNTRLSNVFGGALSLFIDQRLFQTEHTISLDYLSRENARWREIYDGQLKLFHFDIRPHFRYAQTDSFEFFDLYRLGGAHSLRGYFDDHFLVQNAAWINLEYKRLFRFPVFDIGYIE